MTQNREVNNFPTFHGPQGDVQYVYNAVRCVRDVSITNSINESKNVESSFIVYPNPARNLIAISSDYEIKKISIYNSIGERIMERSTNQKEFTINAIHLSNGIYFIHTISKDGITAFNKIIISK